MKLNKFNYYIAIFVALLLSANATAQQNDKVFLKNKECIEGKLIRVTDKNIEIDPVGEKPFLSFTREEVDFILYPDNTVVKFDNEEASIDNSETKDVELEPLKCLEHYRLKRTDTQFFKEEQDIMKVFDLNENTKLKISGRFKYDYSESGYSSKLIITLKDFVLKAELIIDGKSYVYDIYDPSGSRKNYFMAKGKYGSLTLDKNEAINLGGFYLMDYELKCSIDGTIALFFDLSPL